MDNSLSAQPATSRSPRLRGIARRAAIGAAGLVVALIVIGQMMFVIRAASSGAWTSGATAVHVPAHGPLAQQLAAVLPGALGPSDRGVRRFEIVSVHPGVPHRQGAVVQITWAINRDLSAGTIGNGAAADVYVMLRDIFTAHLSIGAIKLDGTYPLHGRETVVMRLAMRRANAALIGDAGWENLDPQTLWPLVDRLYVNPLFRPLPSD